ncbi:serine hydrolase [Streptomyces sp. SAJ15]|uniref:serine hydrolase domain-containing protein n=1 Tax=Streptomyces sp. SAJ15 TaxID=2011095 RepID=UPI0011851AE6|nr:serine hydrolase domain-containing protein [Streptomyces sp. SAJ15]TVL92621.1 serine hydrolase [Streptomyces sp. SAJ15]
MTAESVAQYDALEFAAPLPATRRALLHRLAVGQTEGRTPSLVGCVVRDGRVVWTGARSCVDGHAPDGDTQYRIGSLTKTFVAVLVLRLRNEGLLRLDDPLVDHLPEATEAGTATVAQLLSHTAGLAAEPRGPWWERTPGALRPEPGDVFGERPLVHPAGRRFHYSNSGFALLGAVVERLRGAPWNEVLRREVLEPLGLRRTTTRPCAPHAGGWAVHPWADVLLPEPAAETGLMSPAGELWSTAEDLGRWAAFLLDGDDRVLDAATLAEMRTPAAVQQPGDRDGGWGLGLQLTHHQDRFLFGHGGSMPGFLAALWISPEDRLAAVVLANATSGPQVGPVAADLVRIVAEHEPPIPEPWRPLPADEVDPALLELTGPWFWGAAPFVLRLWAGRMLELSPVGAVGRASRFLPESDGTWTGLDGYYLGETLRVVFDADGALSHLDVGTFVFTREPYGSEDVVPGGVDPRGWRGL